MYIHLFFTFFTNITNKMIVNLFVKKKQHFS